MLNKDSEWFIEGEKLHPFQKKLHKNYCKTQNSRKNKDYETLFKYSNDAILILNPKDYTITDVNTKACDLYGYKYDEFIGQNIRLIAKNPTLLKRNINHVLNDRLTRTFETTQTCFDRKLLNILVKASLISYREELAILCVNRDITERKQTINQFEKSGYCFQQLFDNNPHPIWIYDLDTGNFLAVNKEAIRLYGYSKEEFSQMTLKDLSDEDISHLLPNDKSNDNLPISTYFSSKHRKKDGAFIEVEIRTESIIFDGKESCLTLITDITKSKRIQTESQIISEIIQGISTTSNLDELFQLIQSSLKKILYAENCFVALHDKKTDLFTMRFFVDQIDEGPPNPIKLSRSCSRYVFQTQKPLLMNKQVFDDLVKQGEVVLVGAPPVCWMGTPLRTPTETIGVLVVQHYEDENAYDNQDLELLTYVADQIATAIQRKWSEDLLRESEYNLRTLIKSMREGLIRINNETIIEFVNERFCEMTGYKAEELIDKIKLNDLFETEQNSVIDSKVWHLKKDSYHFERRLNRKFEQPIDVIVGIAPIVNAEGIVTGSMAVFTNISERKNAERQLLHDAFHDGLTGLANRCLFMEHLRIAIERAKRNKDLIFAVFFLDFDRFKIINDSMGHAEGDRLLKLIAQRLSEILRPGDLVARLGGDEFTILVGDIKDEKDAIMIVERIQNKFNSPFQISGQKLFISASIGIKCYTPMDESAENMIRDADIAMYAAKAQGRAQFQIFNYEMHMHATTKLQLETEMRYALKHKQFQIYYQPIVNLRSEKLIGFEALVRWKHNERGIIPPMEFISAAEENGLIFSLGQWILEESCKQLKKWHNLDPLISALFITVNLSSKQFLRFDLAEQVTKILQKTKLQPQFLKLEITENNVMENIDSSINIMNKLRQLGVKLCLDDFGTGYSSLSYLHQLPIDFLKIDRSFISLMIDSEQNREIVYTIMKLAQNLKMKVIAEGIETAEQAEFLRYLQCEFGQGYFFSKAMSVEKTQEYLYNLITKPRLLPFSQDFDYKSDFVG